MSSKTEKIRKINKLNILKDLKFRLIFEGVVVGLFVGIVISLLRLVLSKADIVRNSLIEVSKESFGMAILAFISLATLLGICAVISVVEPLACGSGIPQVKGELVENIKSNWVRVLILKFIGGIAAIYAGLSLGHEGPSVQLGAMVGKGYSRLTGRFKKEERYLMLAGAGAGLAAAFNAPLAGIVFVLEEIRRKFSHKALLSTMAASITADFVASNIFGLDPVFDIEINGAFELKNFWIIILLGLFLGLMGAAYNRSIPYVQRIMKPLKKKFIIWPITFAIIVTLAIVYPYILGSGHDLVTYANDPTNLFSAVLIMMLLKFTFTVYSFGVGTPGGIFLPLLVIGALSGAVFFKMINEPFGLNEDLISYFVIFGMAGYFSAVFRAPISGIILITEMTGMEVSLLSLSLVSLISYIFAEVLGAEPLYDQLLENLLNENPKYRKENTESEEIK